MLYRSLLIYCALIILFVSCNKEDSDTDRIREKSGIINFEAGPDFQNKVIPIHYFVPEGGPKGKDVQIVLHGADRNANDYLAGWAHKARIYNVIVLAPEFSAADFNTAQFNEGNYIVSGQINDADKTTFSLIDRIFDQLILDLEAEATTYNIYGHSAGAQFVHRYLQFYNSTKVDKAVAANAGWYTFPNEAVSFPYGIRNLFQDESGHRSNYYQKNLTVLLGAADTIRDNNLRVTQQADQQGRHRFERGNNFFEYNSDLSIQNNFPFNWNRFHVEGIGHQHRDMSAAAADILYGN